jgi:tetratricopeptide (TPR) repeat protein/DNA-binding CsgD family transcriptional regulator
MSKAVVLLCLTVTSSFGFNLKAGLMAIIMMIAFLPMSAGQETENEILSMPDDTVKVNRLLGLGEKYCSIENDKALSFLQEAFTIATGENYPTGIGRSLLWQGRVYYYKDDYKLADKYFNMAESALNGSGDRETMVLLSFFRGEMCKLRGDYINAMNHYTDVLELTRVVPNKIISSTSYSSIGTIMLLRNDPEKALGYFREALRQKKEIDDRYGISCVMSQIGKAYEDLSNYDSSLYYYNESLEIREALHASRVIASSKYDIGGLLILLENYDEAIVHLEDARKRYEELEEKTGVCITDYLLARALDAKGDPRGLALAMNTQQLAAEMHNPDLVSRGFRILADIYSRKGMYEQAYHSLEQHKKIEDSLFSAEKERFLVEFEQKFQSEQKDHKIARLRDEGKIQQKNILLLSISSFTLLAILVLLIILFRYKSQALKRSALLMEQENVIHAQESRIRENENRMLQEQLEGKNRELASKALEMIRFNDTISSIIEKLEGLNNKEETNAELSSQIRGIIHELENHTKQNIWNEFDRIFKNIHSGFYQRLLDRCPDLTPTEIKTAALLKLNLTTKEIAAITFKSEGGIKTTRYRLRKKLNLSSDDKLIPFLMQI